MRPKSYAYLILLIFLVLLSGFKLKTKTDNNKPADNNFRKISSNVYLFKDICNVYLLKSGNTALLIDAGSGKVANHLKEIGVDKVEWVFHTHYHRDQSIGSNRLKQAGSKIAAGESESELLDSPGTNAPYKIPDEFLLNGELPDWGRRLAPFKSPGVDKKLCDKEVINWNQYKITVINTPGHTKGSISFFTEADGEKLCFTGDLILKGGYARDLYSMQWIYLQNPGLDSSIVSLQKIKKLNPDLLLPSHGTLLDQPSEDMELMNIRLEKVRNSFNDPRSTRWNWSQFVQVSEHVVQDGGSTTQIILSDSGEALLFDCGKEFSPERLQEAKAKFGINHIDVVIPSHWHYDHVDGITEIAKAEGAKVWVWEGLAEYLTHPERFPTTCWTGKSIKIDRVLKEEVEFVWEGNSFKVYHHPVHTEQQMGLYTKIDGLDFYLVADGTRYSKNGNIRCSIHCYNGITLSSGMIKTAQSLYRANPYICLPAHSNVFGVASDDKNEFLNWATETTDAIRSLLAPPLQDLGYDPYWATFYPIRVRVRAGKETETSLRLKNYSNHPITGKYRLKSYGDIIIGNKTIEYELQPGETAYFPVKIKSKSSARNGIHILTADIEYDKLLFGEYPQAYIEVNE
jgi:glyoxylase-like metal-dependent hydrolase (beta-lactamase superfamily II)